MTVSTVPLVAIPSVRGASSVREVRAELERLDRERDTFALSTARRVSGGLMAVTSLGCVAASMAAGLLLPPAAALGVSAAASLGLSALGMLGVNGRMGGVVDKGLLTGAGTFNASLSVAVANAAAGPNPVAWLAAGALVSAVTGMALASCLESRQYGAAEDVSRARGLLDKYDAYRKQHAALEEALRSQQTKPGAP